LTEKQTEEQKETQDWLANNLLNEDRIHKTEGEQMSQELLRKYIIYARRYIRPKLNEIDKEKVT